MDGFRYLEIFLIFLIPILTIASKLLHINAMNSLIHWSEKIKNPNDLDIHLTNILHSIKSMKWEQIGSFLLDLVQQEKL